MTNRTAVRGSAALAALVAVGMAATSVRAAEPAVSLDQGVDVRALTRDLRRAAAESPARPIAALSSEFATRDCATFTFGPGDAGSNAPQGLESRVFRSICREVNDREYCEDVLVRTESRSVAIAFKGARSPLPWETEAFVACLEGDDLDADVAKAAHKYRLEERTQGTATTIEATAVKKIPTDPDPKGLSVASFVQDPAGGLALTLSDKWAEQYRGERTVLSVRLKRDHPHWFDKTLAKAEFAMPAAGSYAIPFAKVQGVEAGGKYYAEWSFSRAGKISTDRTVNAGKTASVTYK